jgi:hypothetical protein
MDLDGSRVDLDHTTTNILENIFGLYMNASTVCYDSYEYDLLSFLTCELTALSINTKDIRSCDTENTSTLLPNATTASNE